VELGGFEVKDMNYYYGDLSDFLDAVRNLAVLACVSVKLLFNSEEKLPFVALLLRSKCEEREDPELTGDFSLRRVVVFSLDILGLNAIFNSYYLSSC